MAAAAGGGQSRRWCFTLNNPTPDERVPDLWGEWPHLRGGVCQMEKGQNETLHYQGYVQFDRPTRLAALKKLLQRAHWEAARGDSASNLLYCTKEDGRQDGPWRIGELLDQGDRSDWQRLKDDLDQGLDEPEIATKHFRLWISHRSGINAYRTLVRPQRDWHTDLIVVCGPTGTGKSRGIAELCPGAFWAPGDGWWDNYAGERVVVLDEFAGTIPFRFLLKLADRYPLQLPVKGGFVPCQAHCVIITSNLMPNEWYSAERNTLPALYRRITLFIWMGEGDDKYVQRQYRP